jgi:putative FmdB family regulatory protein
MPTYEYRCEACGHEWEAFQSMKDDPLTDCPECGEPKAKRQISAGTGFILKGGGWYADGYGGYKVDASRSEATKTTEADPSSYKTPKKDDSAKSGGSDSKSKSDGTSGSD